MLFSGFSIHRMKIFVVPKALFRPDGDAGRFRDDRNEKNRREERDANHGSDGVIDASG